VTPLNWSSNKGYSTNEVGRRLGINQTNVYRWVREYRQENEASVNGSATRSGLENEVKRLHKENQ
jgi:transposase-like protein